MNRTCHGITLVEIMVVVVIIGMLVAIAIPSFMKSRETSQQNACMNNVRLVRDALTEYKSEHGGVGAVDITIGDLLPWLKSKPICPSGGTYADVGNVPYCNRHDDRSWRKLNADDF